MFLQAVGIAAKLRFDPVGRAVECELRFPAAGRRLQHDAVHHRRDNVAGIIVVGPPAERHIGSNRARKILFRYLADSPLRVLAKRFAGVDLMARDPNIHRAWLLSL